MTDIVVPYLQIENNRFLEYLFELNTVKRLEMILEDIYHEIEIFEIERRIDDKINKELEDNQKEYILRQKIKAIKEELGDTSLKEDEVDATKETILNSLIKDAINNSIETFTISE